MTDQPQDRVTITAALIAVAAVIGMVVAVPSLLPRPLREAIGLGPDRIADAPAGTGRGSHAFLRHQRGAPDEPVGYDPCQRIRIQVNLDQAPPGGRALVEQAMARIEQATGLRFDDLGATTDRPSWESESVPTIFGRPRGRPALVSWATADEVGELAGDVAGVGGSVSVADNSGRIVYVTGGVTLDAEVFTELDGSPAGRREQLAIVLHEFGHLVGLAHVHDPDELMNEENLGRLDFGPGDLEGLARVGSIDCS